MEPSNPFTSKVFDKLAQLKQWQSEQHERLIREQEEQRRILLEEQNNRMQNIEIGEEIPTDPGEDEIHGVSILSSDSDSDHHTVTLNTMAEVTFDRTFETTDNEETHAEVLQKPHSVPPSVVLGEGKRKFTFLRRGEGLSRFRMSPLDVVLQNKRIQASKAKSGAKKVVNQAKAEKKSVKMKAPPADVRLQRKQKTKPPVVTADGKMMVPRAPSFSYPKLTLNNDTPRVPPPTTTLPDIATWVANTAQYVSPPVQTMATASMPVGPQPMTSVRPHFSGLPLTMSHGAEYIHMPSSVPTPGASQAVSYPRMITVPNVTGQQVFVAENGNPWVTCPVQVVGPLDPSTWSAALSQPQHNTAPVQAETNRVLEQRELRTFERLERIAADSSFCSSSSLVTRFIEGGYLSSSVQSTPQATPIKQTSRGLQLPETSTPNPTIKNAKALIERLAAIKFTDQPCGPQARNEITLDLRPLEGQQTPDNNKEKEETLTPHVRFQEHPQIHEVEAEIDAWSDSEEEESSEETDSESEQTSSEETQTNEQGEDEKVVIGSLVHTRLEELEQELLKVQRQHIALTKQTEELSQERQRLACIVTQVEEEKRRLEIDRKNFNISSKKKQQQDREEVEQLKKQLSEMESAWKDREARWASSQASQRAQLRQLSLENKEMALQISQLKSNQAKKVQFAKPQKRPEVKIVKRSVDGKITSTTSATNTPERSSYFTNSTTSPTVSAMKYNNASMDSYHLVNSPSGENVSSQVVPSSAEDLSSLSELDVDSLIAKYKRLFGQDPTPYSSLAMDSPGGITRAYDALFNNKDESVFNLTANETTVRDTSHELSQENLQENQSFRPMVDSVQVQTNSVAQNEVVAQISNQNYAMQAQPPIIRPNLVPHQTIIDNQMLAEIWRQNQQAQIQQPNIKTSVGRQSQNSIENQVIAQMMQQNQLTQQFNSQAQTIAQINQQPNIIQNQMFRPSNTQNSVENQMLTQMIQQQRPNTQLQNSVAVQTSFLIGQVQGTYQDTGTNILNPPLAQNVIFNSSNTTQNSAVSDLQRVIRNSDFIRVNAENAGFVRQGCAVTGVSASGDAGRTYAPRNSEFLFMEDEMLGRNSSSCEFSEDMVLSGINRTQSSGVQQSRMNITASGDSSVPEVGNSGSSKKSQSTGFYKISTQFSEISIVSAVGESSCENSEVQKNEVGFVSAPKNYVEEDLSGASCVVYLEDGSRRMWFPNGNTMTVNADNTLTTMYLHNGDIQETSRLDNQVRYYYSAKKVWETNYPDGTSVFTFPDGQRHKIYPSGRKEISLADDRTMTVFEDGRKETTYPNGAKNIQHVDGTVVLYHPNGTKETQTTDKRVIVELTNGIVTTQYPSGLTERKYTDGRTVVKDSTGKVLLDSANQQQ